MVSIIHRSGVNGVKILMSDRLPVRVFFGDDE
jgi:hypothetical protein